jgi:hypothetical protein
LGGWVCRRKAPTIDRDEKQSYENYAGPIQKGWGRSILLPLSPALFLYLSFCSFAALFGGNRYFSAEKMQKGGKNT